MSLTLPSEREENREAMMLDEPCASGEQNETNTASLVSTAITMDVETQTEEQSGTTRMDAETQKKKDVEAARERSERAKARRKSAIERQEEEAIMKRKFLNESGERIVGIDFTFREGRK